MKKILLGLENTKCEYFENGKWIEYFSSPKMHEKYDFNKLIHRMISKEKIISVNHVQETYFLGDNRHRIDGPAHIYYIREKIYSSDWYIYNKLLFSFAEYCKGKISKNDHAKMLFRYISYFPQYIEEIKMIARHNQWLTEDQILLLEAINMFKS
jgi:hypothetical protein